MPMTPLPPRRCARYSLAGVRLMKPPCVIVMIAPSLAMRSSMLISPSSGTICVRRGVACFALMACTSSLMIVSTRDSLRQDVHQVA